MEWNGMEWNEAGELGRFWGGCVIADELCTFAGSHVCWDRRPRCPLEYRIISLEARHSTGLAGAENNRTGSLHEPTHRYDGNPFVAVVVAVVVLIAVKSGWNSKGGEALKEGGITGTAYVSVRAVLMESRSLWRW
jgi:hypothetical protein